MVNRNHNIGNIKEPITYNKATPITNQWRDPLSHFFPFFFRYIEHPPFFSGDAYYFKSFFPMTSVRRIAQTSRHIINLNIQTTTNNKYKEPQKPNTTTNRSKWTLDLAKDTTTSRDERTTPLNIML